MCMRSHNVGIRNVVVLGGDLHRTREHHAVSDYYTAEVVILGGQQERQKKGDLFTSSEAKKTRTDCVWGSVEAVTEKPVPPTGEMPPFARSSPMVLRASSIISLTGSESVHPTD